jgi:hypothetical protein
VTDFFATGNWTPTLNHLPQSSFLLVAILPLIGIVTVWLLLASRTLAKPKAAQQWVLLRDQDAEGIPLLAEGSSMRRTVAPVRRMNPNYRRSDY